MPYEYLYVNIHKAFSLISLQQVEVPPLIEVGVLQLGWEIAID
jgi:hypothetical protein